MTKAAIYHLPETIPSYISIEVTSKCNLFCKMCSLTQGLSSTSSRATYFSDEMWLSIRSSIRGVVDLVQFTGFGEPTLHKNFGKMLNDLNSDGVHFGFTTNGTSISEDFAQNLAKFWLLKHVNVSIDTADRGVYKQVRGGKLEKVLDNIEKLSAVHGNFVLSVSAVAMRSTVSTLDKLPSIIRSRGVRHLVIQSLFDQSSDGIEEDISLSNAAEQSILSLKEEAQREGINLIFEHSARIEDDLSDTRQFGSGRDLTTRDCNLPWSSLHLDANGTVFPCCRAAAENASALGNLKNATLEEIWNGPQYNDFRRSLSDPHKCPQICSKCTVARAGIPAASAIAAELVADKCPSIDGGFIVTFCNTGDMVWQGSKMPVLATASPQNRFSFAYHDSWISPARVTLPLQSVVSPGEVATYVVWLAQTTTYEIFQLVLEGSHWLHGTRFSFGPVIEEEFAPANSIVERSGLRTDIDVTFDLSGRATADA